LEYKFRTVELNGIKGSIGEQLARSFIRNKLAPKLAAEEGWDHVLLSHNDYKENLGAWNQKLFSFERFRNDFLVHGVYADMKLLAKYAETVGVLVQNHCTPDGLLFKLRETGKKHQVCERKGKLNNTLSKRPPRAAEKYPVVGGELEIVEIKCGRSARLMSKQKEAYNNLIAKRVPLRMIQVRIVSFDLNRFIVEQRRFERFL
jgi:hypothetical protein